MKKICLILCLFFMLIFSAFADNIDHQAEWEGETILEMMDSAPDFFKISRQKLLEDDLKGYYSGYETTYGLFLALEEEYRIKNDINYKCFKQIVNAYSTALKTRKVSDLKPVYFNAAEYDKLEERTKNLLAFHNYLAGAIEIGGN